MTKNQSKAQKTQQVIASEVAQGQANVAANLAMENAAPAPEQKKRGRKPGSGGNSRSFAAFSAAIRAGIRPEWVTAHPQTEDANRRVTYAHWTSEPVLEISDDGSLTRVHFTTEGRSMTAKRVVLECATAEETLAFLSQHPVK